jgi:hypothetical protein
MITPRHLMTAAVTAALALLGGCATRIHFESTPPGARVVYEQRNLILGTTPFDATVYDDFGWFSRYRFTATLAGYEGDSVEFRESTPVDAQNVLPKVIRFQLKPREPVTSAPSASSPRP